MHLLLYNELNTSEIPEFEKVTAFLQRDDFRSANVKKVGNNLYRARLNKADRLLFSLYRDEQHTYALILEHIKNHDYQKSRFLRRGVKVDPRLIPSPKAVNPENLESLPNLEKQSSSFHLLHKPISLDEVQQHIYELPLPIVIIGTAGSGKTLLLLEKMKRLQGKLLYITQSAHLARHSQSLYYSHQYQHPKQTAVFLSFSEFIDSIAVPSGKKMTLRHFKRWFSRHQKATPLSDAHALYEEFRGVITGASIHAAYLTKDEYLQLGIRESIFTANQREAVYHLFQRYLDYLKEHNYYDHNILSFNYLSLVSKCYDYVIVDEVQDISPIQLHLILSSLQQPSHFLLCGDANQIVYPNFFSWAKIKTLFLQQNKQNGASLTQILNTNYRNSGDIIKLANKILRLKNWRFGSIDKETHHEMQSVQSQSGQVAFLTADEKTLAEIDHKTRYSKDFAVIVLHDEQKNLAASYFQTPLVFSVQECKGLEYANVILFNMVSCASENYAVISQGVTTDILDTTMRYARNKDKTDKSLETSKFFINALFVAITRAQNNLYWIEEQPDHPLLNLLHNKQVMQDTDSIGYQTSTEEEWQEEASKLEQQGKTEQAQHIRQSILQQHTPSWTVIAGDQIDQLYIDALENNDKKAKLLLFEYALVYEDHQARNALINIEFLPAFHPEDGKKQLLIKYFMMYQQEQLDAIKRQMSKYGVDFRNPFNQTPLMIGAWLGNARVITLAKSLNADPFLANNKGFNAFQIALEQACLHEEYAQQKLPAIYELLRPETLAIRLHEQLITLQHYEAEYFLVNLMIALFYRILPENIIFSNGGFNASNLLQAIAPWPDHLLPEDYKKPNFINQVLADNPDLFVTTTEGNYLLNPDIMLKAEGEWLPIYDILWFDDLAIGFQSNSHISTNDLQALLLEKIDYYKQALGISDS